MEDQVTVNLQQVSEVIGDRYEVIDLLGEGGMASVYRAKHVGLNKIVALKLLHLSVSAKPSNAGRFELEAQLAAGLSHENIVQIFDYGAATNGNAFVAMEFVEGEPLSQLIAKNGAMNQDQCLPIFIDIARGLCAAHQAKIVHRDIKPSNVLVSEKGGLRCAKIADFGLAKAIGECPDDSSKLTQTAEIIGSPSYMSPEQALGLPVDEQTDIYSFGCLMFESLTGGCPFVGENPMQTLMQHIHASRSDLSTRLNASGVSETLSGIVQRCLSKEKKNRYATMSEVLADLELCKSGARTGHTRRSGSKVWVASILALSGILAVGLLLSHHALSSFAPNTVSLTQPAPPQSSLKSTTGQTLYWSEKPLTQSELIKEAASKVQLPKLDVSGSDLSHLTLTDAGLFEASFKNCNLSNASFGVHCNLMRADFQGAQCQSMALESVDANAVSFLGADLTGATFRKCRFTGANFDDATLSKMTIVDCEFQSSKFLKAHFNQPQRLLRCTFVDCDLRGVAFPELDLSSCAFPGTSFADANLSGSNFSGTNLGHADFSDAILNKANFSGAQMGNANFSRCQLSHATFTHSNLRNAQFSRASLAGCDLSRAGLAGADLAGADLQGADLTGADLTGANLDGVRAQGAVFTDAILPARYEFLKRGS